MGGWRKEVSFSDYTVLYALRLLMGGGTCSLALSPVNNNMQVSNLQFFNFYRR